MCASALNKHVQVVDSTKGKKDNIIEKTITDYDQICSQTMRTFYRSLGRADMEHARVSLGIEHRQIPVQSGCSVNH